MDLVSSAYKLLSSIHDVVIKPPRFRWECLLVILFEKIKWIVEQEIVLIIEGFFTIIVNYNLWDRKLLYCFSIDPVNVESFRVILLHKYARWLPFLVHYYFFKVNTHSTEPTDIFHKFLNTCFRFCYLYNLQLWLFTAGKYKERKQTFSLYNGINLLHVLTNEFEVYPLIH